MIQAVSRVAGYDVPYTIVSPREGDIAEIFADTTKAKTILGRESNTSLDESIQTMIRFERMRHTSS
jgi:UDP-glucose 4-epimerase